MCPLIVWLMVVFLSSVYSERVYYNVAKGFTLTSTHVDYDCGKSTYNDVTLHVWDFSPPSTMTSLTVKNCHTLRLHFGCSTRSSLLKEFKVANITNLFFIPVPYTRLSPDMTFENITKIESIPRGTFYHLQNSNPYSCLASTSDLETLVFQDVNINFIESEGFKNLTDIKFFMWDGVKVDRINKGGVEVTLAKDSKGIVIKNCIFGVFEPLAFHLFGHTATFANNTVLELHSTAIDGTFSDFTFKENTVGMVHPVAFVILSQHIYVLDNSFDYLQSGAFKSIGPGMLSGVFHNFGKLKFVYVFKNNAISFADVGSLHPDMEAYNNIASEIVFTYNALQCSCENMAWLASDIGLGKGYSPLKSFHKNILDPQNHNICIYTPCILPIEVLREGVTKGGDCERFLAEDEVCKFYNKTPQAQFQRRDDDWVMSSNNKIEVVYWMFLISVFTYQLPAVF